MCDANVWWGVLLVERGGTADRRYWHMFWCGKVEVSHSAVAYFSWLRRMTRGKGKMEGRVAGRAACVCAEVALCFVYDQIICTILG